MFLFACQTICNVVLLFANWYGIIEIFVGLAVFFLLRHNVDYVLRIRVSFVASSGRVQRVRFIFFGYVTM